MQHPVIQVCQLVLMKSKDILVTQHGISVNTRNVTGGSAQVPDIDRCLAHGARNCRINIHVSNIGMMRGNIKQESGK